MDKYFLMGAAAYPAAELLWRGRTHPAMAAAGGLSLFLMARINRRTKSIVKRSLLGAGAVTAVELGFGLALNRDHVIWDYTGVPYNFRGQICLPYSALWAAAAAGFSLIYDIAEKR